MRLEHFTAVTVAAALAACASSGTTSDPNAGLLRDFLDGKYDGAGHPINAIVTEAEALCQGSVSDGAVELAAACSGSVNGGQQVGDLIASARLRVDAHPASGLIATIDVTDNGATLATTTLTVDTLRSDGAWLDVPVAWSSNGDPIGIRVTPAAGAQLAFDYVEVFPSRFGLVISPGAGVVADSDHVTFELPADRALDRVEVDGVDVTAQVTAVATVQTTAYRKIYDLAVADLAPNRGDVADIRVDAAETAARTTLRRTVPTCNYEGGGTGAKVLVTGFQPFPADGTHDNVSGVAVTALDPSSLRGARVMRLVIPVEYDRAPAEVTDAIARCAPDIVISFGQGGDAIALEQTAYNLQDTGEVTGGVPDNRGVIRAAQPIDSAAAATRATLLPLDAINSALVGLGEQPQLSTDPGRYVCNNVMFADVGAMTGKRAGFIHLPYTEEFDAANRARFGKIVAAAIQATVDSSQK